MKANYKAPNAPNQITRPQDPHEMNQAGVTKLSEAQLHQPIRAAIGSLPFDARKALTWLRRGPWVTSPLLPLFVRRALLRRGGVRLGRRVYGLWRCYLESPNISIGSASGLNYGCWFEGDGEIEIGADCLIGPHVMILTSIHDVGAHGQVARETSHRPVRIGRGCWLGARAIVLPGVTIGAGAIIAAGAVVTNDCEPGGLYGGVPAKRIR